MYREYRSVVRFILMLYMYFRRKQCSKFPKTDFITFPILVFLHWSFEQTTLPFITTYNWYDTLMQASITVTFRCDYILNIRKTRLLVQSTPIHVGKITWFYWDGPIFKILECLILDDTDCILHRELKDFRLVAMSQ